MSRAGDVRRGWRLPRAGGDIMWDSQSQMIRARRPLHAEYYCDITIAAVRDIGMLTLDTSDAIGAKV